MLTVALLFAIHKKMYFYSKITNILYCLTFLHLKSKPAQALKDLLFSHPVTGGKVYVMMDACHILKLARNILHVYSPNN